MQQIRLRANPIIVGWFVLISVFVQSCGGPDPEAVQCFEDLMEWHVKINEMTLDNEAWMEDSNYDPFVKFLAVREVRDSLYIMTPPACSPDMQAVHQRLIERLDVDIQIQILQTEEPSEDTQAQLDEYIARHQQLTESVNQEYDRVMEQAWIAAGSPD